MNAVTTPGYRIEDLVDLEAYPIHRPDSAAYAETIATARQGLKTEECSYLPDFLKPEAQVRMQAEAERLARDAIYFSQEHNPYFSAVPEEAPARDPRRMMGRKTNGLVPGDAFPREGLIWRLFREPAMKRFVEDCLAVGPLFYYEDPYGCLNVSVQKDGDAFDWHFDTNEFTVSLLLQQPERGGVFQFAPNIRTPGDECYDEVASVIEGDRTRVVDLDLRPGDLQIFKGRYSVHRVTAVEGAHPRLIALFAYARAPGMYASPERSQQIWGRVHPDQIAAEARRSRADSLVD